MTAIYTTEKVSVKGHDLTPSLLLVLSGHNHGGQIWPWSYLVRLQQPVISGLHRFGDTFLYVTQGTGFWGPPMRLGTRSEIALLVLRSMR